MIGFKPEVQSESALTPPRVYEIVAAQNLSEMVVNGDPQKLSAEQANKTAGEPSR